MWQWTRVGASRQRGRPQPPQNPSERANSGYRKWVLKAVGRNDDYLTSIRQDGVFGPTYIVTVSVFPQVGQNEIQGYRAGKKH